MLGVKKPYYVRDYLSPKHIKEHGLAEILEAMEVGDNSKRKKRLLSYLWPNTNQNFSITFQPFKREKPGVQNEYENQGNSAISVRSSELSGLVDVLMLSPPPPLLMLPFAC